MALVSLRGSDGLVWKQARPFGRAIEIYSGDHLAAILRLNGWLSHCDATSADGMWHFQRKGFFGRRIVVTRSPAGEPIGILHPGMTGRFDIGDGTRFLWKRISFWKQEMAFLTSSEFRIVKFAPKRFTFKDAGMIGVTREYTQEPQLPLLILLGTYLTILAVRRARSS